MKNPPNYAALTDEQLAPDAALLRSLRNHYAGQRDARRGVCLLNAGNFAQAEQAFRQAAARGYRPGQLPRLLAACALGTGDRSRAADHLSDACDHAADESAAVIRLAYARWSAGEPAAAVALLREALRGAPECAALHFHLGVLLASRGELEEAELRFTQVQSIERNHVDALVQLALCCAARHAPEEALGFLRRALTQRPDDPRIGMLTAQAARAVEQRGHVPALRFVPLSEETDFSDEDVTTLASSIRRDPEWLEACLALPADKVEPSTWTLLLRGVSHVLTETDDAELRLHAARLHARLGQFEAARTEAEKAVALRPHFTRALIELGRLYERSERLEAAASSLRAAVAAGAEYADVHYLLGNIERRRGNIEDARRAYQKALAINARFGEAQRALAALAAEETHGMSYLLEILGRGLLAQLAAAFDHLLRDDGRFSTEELESLVNISPDEPEHRRRLGIRHLNDHRHQQARRIFQEGLDRDPADTGCRIGLACALDEMGRTREAVEQLQHALKICPEDGALWFALGFCREKLGDTDEALAAYESAVDIAPHLRNAHERLAAIYLKLDNLEMAIAHYEHLCWCAPDDMTANLTLAGLLLRAERYTEAIKRYEFALSLDPEHWEAQDDYISACAQAGRHEEAIDAQRELIAQRPHSAEGHLRLGDLYRAAGQDAPALKAYESAWTLNPDYLEAAIKVGTTHLRDGSAEKAAQAFAQAIEINDRVLTGYVGLGVAQHALGRQEDALASFELAAGIEPNSTLLFGETARLHLQMAAAEQAAQLLSPKAVAAGQPSSAEQVRAVIARQVRQLEKAAAEHPRHADLHYRLGVLYRQQDNLPQAIEAFQRAVAINPNYLKALVRLGIALRESGDTPAALAAFERALAIDPESIDLHYQLGLLFCDRGEFAAAVRQFEVAAAARPENKDYLASLALSLQDMGLVDRAEATWQLLLEAGAHADVTPVGV